MPNINTNYGSDDSPLDAWRRNPGRLVFAHDLAAAGVFRSYDALKRATKSGAFPKPYRLPGGRMAWEARDVLHAIGIAAPLNEEAA